MTVKIHLADDSEEWDTIISKSPHGTPFHAWDWLKITEKHTQTKLYPVMGIKDNSPVGVFPLFFQKKGPLRMVFSPPPHAVIPYLGPVLVESNSFKQENREHRYIDFQNSVDTFIKKDLHAQYISFFLPPNLKDPRPFGWSGYSIVPHYDYITDLSPGSDQLFLKISNKKRQDIKRAKKRGMIVEIGGKREYEAILNLMDIRHKQQQKTSFVSRKYMMDIYDAFSGQMTIIVAKIDDEIISGSIDLNYKNIIYSWIGNPRPKNTISPSPNDLIIWESIRYGCENGFRYYVTMSAAENKRLYSYYSSKFDPTLSIRFSVKKKSFFTGILEKIYMDLFRSQARKKRGYYKQIALEKHNSHQDSD